MNTILHMFALLPKDQGSVHPLLEPKVHLLNNLINYDLWKNCSSLEIWNDLSWLAFIQWFLYVCGTCMVPCLYMRFFVFLFLCPKPYLYYKDTKTVDTICLCVPGMPTFRDWLGFYKVKSGNCTGCPESAPHFTDWSFSAELWPMSIKYCQR